MFNRTARQARPTENCWAETRQSDVNTKKCGKERAFGGADVAPLAAALTGIPLFTLRNRIEGLIAKSFDGPVRVMLGDAPRVARARFIDVHSKRSSRRFLSHIRIDFRSVAAVAAIGLCAFPALAASSDGGQTLRGPGSLAGYWVNTSSTVLRRGPMVGGAPTFRTASGQLIPLLPSVAKLVAEQPGDLHLANEHLPCLTDGMPAVAAPPSRYPIEILETDAQITVLLEWFRNFRIIRMGVDHPEDPDAAFLGDSVGHWDGGALVVDTIGIDTRTTIMGRIPHSDQLRIVERFRRTGLNSMEDRLTIDDPKTFSKPWSTVIRFKKAMIHNLSGFSCGSDTSNSDADGKH